MKMVGRYMKKDKSIKAASPDKVKLKKMITNTSSSEDKKRKVILLITMICE